MQAVKIVVVGDRGVGKKCLLITYTTNSFPRDYIPTVFDNWSGNVLHDGKVVNMGLWDTSGALYNFRRLSYPHTDVLILCVSVESSPSSIERIYKWYNELRHHCPNIPIVLVGTKCDLRDGGDGPVFPLVPKARFRSIAQDIGAFAYVECSSTKNKNVVRVFQLAVDSFVGVISLPRPNKKKGAASKFFNKLKKKLAVQGTGLNRLFYDSSSTLRFWEVLPEYVVLLVLSFMTPYQLIQFSLVSKTTNALAENDTLWIEHCKREDPSYKYNPSSSSSLSSSSSSSSTSSSMVHSNKPKAVFANFGEVWRNPFGVPAIPAQYPFDPP
eukprot:TRINITY_DN6934_c1_g1_i3.p1 TRINITY_DN6934_c1_g1~~TRINITY_DN6934_c1_g1_i3.p1  ORF type:complete len:326 (-),score=49.83 TRINITY_DN6934_c1_g1_i3:158-1135(-)